MGQDQDGRTREEMGPECSINLGLWQQEQKVVFFPPHSTNSPPSCFTPCEGCSGQITEWRVSTKVSCFPAAAPKLVANRDAILKLALTSLRVDSNASCRAFTKSFLLGRLCGTKSPSCDLKNNSEAQYSTQCASICLCSCPGQKQ